MTSLLKRLTGTTDGTPNTETMREDADEITRMRDVLRRLRQWDMLDTSESDGKFWKREIDAVLMPNPTIQPTAMRQVNSNVRQPLLRLAKIGGLKMQPYQQRVVHEKTELDRKAHALSRFIGYSEEFETLDAAEQERLKEQNDVMWQYSEILGARISAFSA